MKKTVIAILLFLLTTACGGSPPQADLTPTAAVLQAAPTTDAAESLDDLGSIQATDNASGLPADAETYYKTMVFIQGTAQLMARIDLASITASDNQAAFLPLMTMPGVMDDHVIAAQQIPAPAGFEAAWEKATEAEAGLTQALQDFLMTYSQDEFNQAVASNEALASDAVAEAEAVLKAQYGAGTEDIAAANRAALTEMGEAYQTFASFIAAGQTQSDDGSQ